MRRPAALVAALAWLAGCAHPIQQPLLELADRSCDQRPLFAAAVPVAFDKPGDAVLGADGPCLRVDGGATTYAAFALPAGSGAYRLQIASLVVPVTIVRPRGILFDAAGQPVRTLEPAEFEPNIVGLRAGVRADGSERWLVVEADRSQLGQHFDVRLEQVGRGVQIAAATPIVVILPPVMLPDVQRRNGGVYSLNGRVLITATPVQNAR